MALALAFLLFISLSTALSHDFSIINHNPIIRAESEVRELFHLWLSGHQKSYNALGEKERRFSIFKDNLMFIDAHNSNPNHTYQLGLNRFADMTNEEFRRHLGLRSGAALERKSHAANGEATHEGVAALPDSIDWRDHGAVAAVKDQGSCGTFSFSFLIVAHTSFYLSINIFVALL